MGHNKLSLFARSSGSERMHGWAIINDGILREGHGWAIINDALCKSIISICEKLLCEKGVRMAEGDCEKRVGNCEIDARRVRQL